MDVWAEQKKKGVGALKVAETRQLAVADGVDSWMLSMLSMLWKLWKLWIVDCGFAFCILVEPQTEASARVAPACCVQQLDQLVVIRPCSSTTTRTRGARPQDAPRRRSRLFVVSLIVVQPWIAAAPDTGINPHSPLFHFASPFWTCSGWVCSTLGRRRGPGRQGTETRASKAEKIHAMDDGGCESLCAVL